MASSLGILVRNLLKTPVTTGIAILSLALGIGANTAMFSITDQILLRSMPVTEPERLVFLYHPGPLQGSVSNDEGGGPVFSYPMYGDLAKAQTVFTGLAGARMFDVSLSYQNQPLLGNAHLVTGNYFEVMGLKPAMGRLLTAADDVNRGGHPVVVLSYRYWENKLGANPAALNQTIIVNGYPMTIVGVVQKGFQNERLGAGPEVFLPMAMKAQITPRSDGLDDRTSYWLTVVGRLKPGMTIAKAQAGINIPYAAGVEEDIKVYSKPSENFVKQLRAKRIELRPGAHGRGGIIREARTPVLMLLGITGVVLLIACANVANLLLARASARAKEIALRLSLGATRAQLMGQLLTESMVIALVSGALGIVVAVVTLRAVVAQLPPTEGTVISADLDGAVLAFTVVVSVVTGLIFGLFPALQATKHDLATVIKDQAGQSSGTGAANRFRKILATAQIAASLLLLVTAGLFGKSLLNLTRINLGIRTDHLISFMVDPELNKYSPEQKAAFYDQLQEKLQAIPGVTSVAASGVPAIAGDSWGQNITVDGFTAPPDSDADNANFSHIADGYFRTMGVALVKGREFSKADNLTGQKVAVVNETFVTHYFNGGEAIGRMFALGGGSGKKPDITIVGVVKDTKYANVQEKPVRLFYVPYRQFKRQPALYFYARTAVDPGSIVPQIRRTVASLDPNLPIAQLKTMQAQLEENIFVERLLMRMTLSFAALATLLAAIGLYGVLAYNVARRTREIGIRMAIGATAGDVRKMVMGEVAVMLGIGMALGLAGAFAAGRLVGSLLFGMEPSDPPVYLAAAMVIALIALGAAYVPAVRATRVDPMNALRYE